MNVIISSIDRILNFGKANNLQGLVFGMSCCSNELNDAAFRGIDFSSCGLELSEKSPKQADLLICTGTITTKTASQLINIYKQMPKPKYVIAFGSCAADGGDFSSSYNAIQGIEKVLPVDITLKGCPPKLEDLIEAVEKLKNDIKNQTFLKRQEEIKQDYESLLDGLDDVNDIKIERFEVEEK